MSTISYKLVVPPEAFRGRSFRSFSRSEIDEYFRWHETVTYERIEYMVSKIKEDFPHWIGDFSRGSLIIIDEWFKDQVNWRLKSSDEVYSDEQQLKQTPKLSQGIRPSATTIDQKSVSIVFDISLYFSECFRRSCPNLILTTITKPRNSANFGQPALLSLGNKMELNPRRIVEVCAKKYIEGNYDKSLVNLYDLWLKVLG